MTCTGIRNAIRKDNFNIIVLFYCRYYHSAIGSVLVFDITRRETFENLSKWLEEMEANKTQDIQKILVGNKSDLRHLRAVTKEEAKEFAGELRYFLKLNTCIF